LSVGKKRTTGDKSREGRARIPVNLREDKSRGNRLLHAHPH